MLRQDPQQFSNGPRKNGNRCASSFYPCCTYRIRNTVYEGTTILQQTISATLLALYICRIIVGYGQFVYKLATVARGTARVDVV
jgi:hypothetical protein